MHDRIAQKIKDFATQSPKLLKGTSDKVWEGVGGAGGEMIGREREREKVSLRILTLNNHTFYLFPKHLVVCLHNCVNWGVW